MHQSKDTTQRWRISLPLMKDSQKLCYYLIGSWKYQKDALNPLALQSDETTMLNSYWLVQTKPTPSILLRANHNNNNIRNRKTMLLASAIQTDALNPFSDQSDSLYYITQRQLALHNRNVKGYTKMMLSMLHNKIDLP